MLVTNLTSNIYDLPGLRLHALEAAAIVDDVRYFADERFRLELNTLYANAKISVASAPIGFPVATAQEIEIANGEVPGATRNGGSSPLLVATVNLSSAQILALHDTPVEVVPVVAGSVIWPVTAAIFYKAGGTPYTMGLGFEEILWAGQNAQGDQVFAEPAGPGDGLVFMDLARYLEGSDVVSHFGNVQIGCTVQNPAGGDGIGVVTVWYTLVATT